MIIKWEVSSSFLIMIEFFLYSFSFCISLGFVSVSIKICSSSSYPPILSPSLFPTLLLYSSIPLSFFDFLIRFFIILTQKYGVRKDRKNDNKKGSQLFLASVYFRLCIYCFSLSFTLFGMIVSLII